MSNLENIVKINETEYMAGDSRMELIDKDIVLSTPVGPHTISLAKSLYYFKNKFKRR